MRRRNNLIKMLALLMLIVLPLSACSLLKDMVEPKAPDGDSPVEVSFKEVSYDDWEGFLADTMGASFDFEIDREFALDYGKAVLIEHFGEKAIGKLDSFTVSEIIGKDCFIVGGYISGWVGGGYNVAFTKKGEVLKIWMDE